MFTGFSIRDFVNNAANKGKKMITKTKDKGKKENNKENDLVDEDSKDSVVIINDNNAPKEKNEEESKLVISSIDELKKMEQEVMDIG